MPRWLLVAYHIAGVFLSLILTMSFAYGNIGFLKLVISCLMIAGLIWGVWLASLAIHNWEVVDEDGNLVKSYKNQADEIKKAVDDVFGKKEDASFTGAVQQDGDGPEI